MFLNVVGPHEVKFLHFLFFTEKVLVAVVQTQYAIAVFEESLGHSADDRVDAGSGTAASEDYDGIFHINYEFRIMN